MCGKRNLKQQRLIKMAVRGRFQLAMVVWRPPGWALPCESELGWHRQERWHFGREKSTGRDREAGKHSLCLGH